MAMSGPHLCTICSQIPHWLASLSWPSSSSSSSSSKSESEAETGTGSRYGYGYGVQSDYLYNDPPITLGSWRWITAQAEAAVAERKVDKEVFFEWFRSQGSGGEEDVVEANAGKGATNQMNIKPRDLQFGEAGAGATFGIMKGGPVGELKPPPPPLAATAAARKGKGEPQLNQKSKGCDICLMIMHFPHRASHCKYNLRPYYLPPEEMDPRTDERVVDVPLVFGREGTRRHVGGEKKEWEYNMVCLSNRRLFYGVIVRVEGGWDPRYQPSLGYYDQNRENNVLLLKDWLENCRKNHTKCYKIKDSTITTMDTTPADLTSFVPTRLLDLAAYGSDKSSSSHLGNDVRLVCLGRGSSLMGSSAPAPAYFTLSHCWGPPEKRPTTTTKANLAQRMERIPFIELPKTFQDAIEITRKLGCRYLWIDSLCIVQDDEHDWAREAALMAKVYSHSPCTLSALSSKDSSEGLRLEPLDEDRSFTDITFPSYHSRKDYGHGKGSNPDPDPEIPFRFRLFYSLNNHWDLIYRGDSGVGPSDNSPLRSRAWTLQERELSRRIIHFAKTQVLWECAELQATAQRPWRHDGIPEQAPEREWNGWSGIVAKSRHDRDLAVTASSLLSAYRSEKEWWEVVDDYTQRFLSKDTDKLVALSGMAQLFHRNHFPDDRYVAGMWSSRLEEEIFWAVDNQMGEALRSRRPAEYVAPSWSWASVSGCITFRPKDPVRRLKKMRNRTTGRDFADTTEKDNKDPRKIISDGWQLEDVIVLPKYGGPYGALMDGSLVISGARLVEAELITEVHIQATPGTNLEFTRYYRGLKKDEQWVAEHQLDVPGEAEQSGCKLWCLGMLAQRDYKERPVIAGLILKEEMRNPDGDLPVYSRMGKFNYMAVKWFDGVEPRRIKLI